MPSGPSPLSHLLKPTLVQAGAGTGKTESLARRIIEAATLILRTKGKYSTFCRDHFYGARYV